MTALHGELLDIVRKDRARRTRRERLAKFVTDYVTSLLTNAVAALFGGWMFMWGVGVAHAHWMPQVPTIGYWWAALIVFLLRGVFSAPQTAAKDVSR